MEDFPAVFVVPVVENELKVIGARASNRLVVEQVKTDPFNRLVQTGPDLEYLQSHVAGPQRASGNFR